MSDYCEEAFCGHVVISGDFLVVGAAAGLSSSGTQAAILTHSRPDQ